MTITALPPVPNRATPGTFADLGDAFLGALPTFATEANALEVNVNALEASAVASAASAAASALAAVSISASSIWVSGTTYAIGDVAWSPANGQSYRRKTAGAGTTDPASDAVNWFQLAAVPDQTGHAGKVLGTDGTAATWGGVNLANTTLTGTLAQFNAAVSDADLVSLAGAETLTNKTLASAVHTGTPTAPTAAAGTNTTQLATTAFATAAVGAYVAGAVGTYIFARSYSATAVAVGATVAGSSLESASVVYTGGLQGDGIALTGTWRCMGYLAGGGSAPSATLFLRIS